MSEIDAASFRDFHRIFADACRAIGEPAALLKFGIHPSDMMRFNDGGPPSATLLDAVRETLANGGPSRVPASGRAARPLLQGQGTPAPHPDPKAGLGPAAVNSTSELATPAVESDIPRDPMPAPDCCDDAVVPSARDPILAAFGSLAKATGDPIETVGWRLGLSGAEMQRIQSVVARPGARPHDLPAHLEAAVREVVSRDSLPEAPAGGDRIIAVSIVASHTATDWPPRQVSVSRLLNLLTLPVPGAKHGRSYVAGAFGKGQDGQRRRQDATIEMVSALVFDIDNGTPRDAILDALRRRGWAAAVAPSYSDGVTENDVPVQAWAKFKAQHPDLSDTALAEAYLRHKGLVETISTGARVLSQGEERVVLHHSPCPKTRVIVPLAKDWRVADHIDRATAIAAFKALYAAVAGLLGLVIDPTGAAPSHLFYLPRYPKGREVPDCRLVPGRLLDPDEPEIVRALADFRADTTYPGMADGAARARAQAQASVDPAGPVEWTDPKTGETIDLCRWGASYGHRFNLVDALKAHAPSVLTGNVGAAGQHDIDCPFAGEHTNAGRDRATIAINAGASKTRGFVVWCQHAHCKGRDRLEFVREMLSEGWLTAASLTDARFLLPDESETGEQAVMRLNRTHAFVMVGGESRILVETLDEKTGRVVSHQIVRKEAAADRIAFDKVRLGKKLVPAFTLWREHPRRRSYADMVFDPSGKTPPAYYNTFHGFAVEPDGNASCPLFLDFVRTTICANDARIFGFVLDWLAHLFQRPGEKPGTALVLTGGQGTGKSFFRKVIERLIGRAHVSSFASEKALTNNFNGLMEAGLLCTLEECGWGKNGATADLLKELVTEERIRMEGKGIEARMASNYLRFIINSNQSEVIRAGLDERRFAILIVSAVHQGDTRYFDGINAEMQGRGGDAALMHVLATRDISHFDPRMVPKTRGLLDQKIATLSMHGRWWLSVLENGRLTEEGAEPWGHPMTRREVYEAYRAYARDIGGRSEPVLDPPQFGRALRGMTPRLRERDRHRLAGALQDFYKFPSLNECRQTFDAWLGQRYDWPTDRDDPSTEIDPFG
jgi:hypothetical protein